jgi:hypothetical protein
MARRAALIALVVGLVSCGSNNGGGSWSCHWQCNSSDPPTSGNATYPDGTNLSQQCQADHGAGCNDFQCACNQN